MKRKILLSFLIVSAFCILSILLIDKPLALYLKAHAAQEWIGFFKIVTLLGEAHLYIVPAIFLIIHCAIQARRALAHHKREQYKAWFRAAIFFLLCQGISGAIVNLLKPLLGRMRPRYLFDQGLYGFEPFNTVWAMNSFPSGHSQAAFAAMMALVAIWPRYDALWLLIAVLVAASRVVTSVHYLSDAVFGSYIAILTVIVLKAWFASRGWSIRVPMERDRALLIK